MQTITLESFTQYTIQGVGKQDPDISHLKKKNTQEISPEAQQQGQQYKFHSGHNLTTTTCTRLEQTDRQTDGYGSKNDVM